MDTLPIQSEVAPVPKPISSENDEQQDGDIIHANRQLPTGRATSRGVGGTGETERTLATATPYSLRPVFRRRESAESNALSRAGLANSDLKSNTQPTSILQQATNLVTET
jgi:hypothetical protein